MSHDDILGHLVGHPPRKLLEDLSQLGTAFARAGRERPMVELQLTSGPTLRGRIIGVSENGAIVTVQVGGSPQAPSVAYIRIDHVIAITVSDASLLAHPPVNAGPVPTRLELARQAQARSDALASTLGHAFAIAPSDEPSDDGKRAVGLALPLVADLLTTLANDPMGKGALAAITRVEISAGPPEVRRDGATLVVRAPVLLADAYTAKSLRTAVERVL